MAIQQYRVCDDNPSSVNDTCKTENSTDSLELIDFGSFADGQFQYLHGESDNTVWPGTHVHIKYVLHIHDS